MSPAKKKRSKRGTIATTPLAPTFALKPELRRVAAQTLAKLDEANRRHKRVFQLSELMNAPSAPVDLDPSERFIVAEILRVTLAGNDPRKPLGIKPRRGKPITPASAVIHAGIAADYLLMREAPQPEKGVAHTIATAYSIKPSYVRECVAKYKQRHASLSKKEMFLQIRKDSLGLRFNVND